MNIGAKSKLIVEDCWEKAINKCSIRSTFSRRTLSLNLSTLSFENKRLRRQFLD